MGDLATLPTFNPSPAAYTHTDFAGFFANLVIAPGAVSFAKFQAINTDKLIGRATAATGSVEEIPCTPAARAVLALAGAANKLPYLTGVNTAALADLTPAGRALLDDADAAAQRATLGVLGSNLQHETTGGIQAGTAGNDLIYTSGPTLDLTVGTWLVWGSAAMRTSDLAGEFWLGFRNTTDGVDFGKGATEKNVSLGEIQQLSCFGFVTVADTKTVRLKGFRQGAITLEMGSTNGISGALRAVRLTT